MAHDVFISHSVKNKTTADAVCAMLESQGVRCWIAPRDVIPGMEWGECIIDAIEQSRIMVLVFTADANSSPQIRREVERAVNHGVAILPVRLEDVMPAKALEYFIGNVHWLDALTPPLEAHLKNLGVTIKLLLARMEPRTTLAAEPPPAPKAAAPPVGSGTRAEEPAAIAPAEALISPSPAPTPAPAPKPEPAKKMVEPVFEPAPVAPPPTPEPAMKIPEPEPVAAPPRYPDTPVQPPAPIPYIPPELRVPTPPAPRPAAPIATAAALEAGVLSAPTIGAPAAGPAAPVAQPAPTAARQTLLLLSALNVFNSAARGILIVEIGMVAEHLSVSYSSIAALLTALPICYAVAALLAGWLGNRFRRKTLIVTGAALFSVSLLGIDATIDFPTIGVIQSVVWMGGAVFDVAALTSIFDLYPERRRSWPVAVFCAGYPLGAALSSFADAALNPIWGWAVPLIVTGVIGGAMTGVYAWLGREPERGASDKVSPPQGRGGSSGILSKPAFLTATFGAAFLSFVLFTPNSRFAVQQLRMLALDSPGAWLGIAVCTVAGTLAGGWIGQRWLQTNRRALYLVSFGSALLVALLLGPIEMSVLLLFFIQLLAYLPTAPLLAAVANSASSSARGIAVSIFLACSHLFSVLAAALVNRGFRGQAQLAFPALAAVILFVGSRFAPALDDGAKDTAA